MIEKYARRSDVRYLNILERCVVFIISEFFETLAWLGVFDVTNQEYKPRRICWMVLSAIIGLFVLIPFYASAILYIYNSIKG